jgi:CheY-like chemotaxis protein
MVIGLGVDVSFAEKSIVFDFKSLTKKRNQVRYHITLKKIVEQAPSQLIIPGYIKACDYNYETLIEHIRTDSNKAIAMIPILVFFEDLEKILPDGFKEQLFKGIAVAFSTNPEKEEFIDKFDEKALGTYLETCFKYPYSQGSHDKTNLWGSLSLLKSLSSIDPGNKDLFKGISELEDNLSEATYFKRLISEFDSSNADKEYIGRLKSESSKLAKISNDTTVLVIEDQLKDGWEISYDLFFSVSSNFKVIFAENEIKAQEIITKTKNIDLVLLDVRLDKERDNYSQDETGHHVENLSGVKLAKWIRGEIPTIPIIAATASNKSWTLEALLEQGINGYWVKGSPNLVTNSRVGIENTLDLIKKIHDTLQWSQATGHCQNELYRIANVVNETFLEGKALPFCQRQIREKAKSLQALLMRSFSPFSNELSDGLQLNLAFINIYSCMNDLVEWACDIKELEKDIWEWTTIGDSKGYVDDELIAKVEKVKEKKSNFWDEWEWTVPFKDKTITYQNMPDKQMAIQLLIVKFGNGSKIKEFKRLTNKRNALPLIHGKRPASGSVLESEDAKMSDIDNLINILGSLVDKHKELLDKYGE